MVSKPSKRKVTGGRVTPKASGPAKVGATPGSLSSKARTPVRKSPKPAASPAEKKKEADAAKATASDDKDEAAGVSRVKSTPSKRVTERGSGRYTAPSPPPFRASPWWVPALMFTLIGVGMMVIFLNYLGVFTDADTPSNMPLVVGLGLILGGIVTATQYH